ncbi:MAG: hypothetical protein SGILL_006783 [Bacillariaceae sp.]
MSMELGIPQKCATEGHMSNLMKCFIEVPDCRKMCFTLNFNRNAGLFDIPEYLFEEGNPITDCSEIEEPVCVYTECLDCEPCRDIINALYRCVIAHSTTLDPKLKTMANCPLDCTGDSFLIDNEMIADDGNNITDSDVNGTRFLLN